jgi:ADP-heptose:LPS heptosyltransferase
VNPPGSILVVKPSSLGDVIHTLPAVHLLKRAFPATRISWLVNSEWAPLLRENPDLDSVVEFPRNQFRGLSGILRLKSWLSSTQLPKPDLALDFQGLARSALLGKFSGAKNIHCLGDAEFLARFLADRVIPARRDQEHSVFRYLRLVSDLGIPVVGPLVSPLPEGTAPEGFDASTPFVLVHPFSRGEGKSLSVEQLGSLCGLLAPLRVVVVGRTDLRFEAPCENLCNRTTIPELIWMTRRAAFVVSVDSGPMHIAAAITHRLLAIHTWSDPRLVGPCNPQAWIWKNGKLIQFRDLPRESMQGGRGIEPEDLRVMAEFCKSEMRF